MKRLLLVLLFCSSLGAQSPSFFITDPTGSNIVGPLSSTYQFADTPEYSATPLVLRATNPSAFSMQIVTIFVAEAPGSAVQSPNFTVTGVFLDKILPPGSSNFEDFTVTFTPAAVGALTGVLRVAYKVQQNGCVLESTDPATQCPETVSDISALQGNGTPPQLVASYSGPSGSGILQPSSSSPQLDFGNVSTSATASFTITLANQSNAPLNTPAISIQSRIFGSSAFQLNTSTLPTSIPPTSPAKAAPSFTVIFAPGQIGLTSATLVIGSNKYPLVGTGVVVETIDALQISYVDQTGVRTSPQAATAISFGTTGAAILTFTVANPITSIDPVTVPSLTLSGAAFSAGSGGLPATPVSIPPGQSTTFQVVFSASAAGTYTGTLSIGTRVFSLIGQAPQPVGGPGSALPGIDLFCGASACTTQTFTSRQQVHMTVQLNAPAPGESIVTLGMSFTSTVSGITGDPAVSFIAPITGRNLQITIPNQQKIGIYNGQSQLTFQTGTTAGTITFTLTYLGEQTKTWTIDIPPSPVQVTSSTAVRSNPNLVLTLTGYDNTYSVNNLTYTFYDTGGHPISSTPLSPRTVANDFHQYFFGPNDAGGAFSVQVSFPVLTGDITQIGSVAVALTNSKGSTPVSVNFR
jgi:hypothetical protein